MHERFFDDDDEDEESRPFYFAEYGDDGGLRANWLRIAAHIAGVEQEYELWSRDPRSRASRLHDGADHTEPGFLLHGDSLALAYIAETAARIIKEGPAFAAWAQHVGGDPVRMQRFHDAYVGRWSSIEAFVEEMVGELYEQREQQAAASGKPKPEHKIDVDAMARRLLRDGDICVLENPRGGVWIFRDV